MNGREIIAAAIQMSSTPDKEENLDTAERLIRSAVSSGAGLIALPELWNCHGLEDVYSKNAESYQDLRRSSSAASRASSGSSYWAVRSSKEAPNLRNCTIHPLSSGLTAGCRLSTVRYTSST
jgi:predicted amidohydrolase